MKKQFTLIASVASLMLISSNLFAGPGDTLGVTTGTVPRFAPNNQAVLYQAQAGGYIFGTNAETGNQITGMAQAYENQSSVKVKQVLALIRKKKKGTNPAQSKLTFALHNLDPQGAIVYSGTAPNIVFDSVPGPAVSVAALAEITFDEIDTASATYTVINFPTLPQFTGNIVVSCDFTDLKAKGDTCGFLADVTGSGGGLQYTFHQITQTGVKIWFPTQFLTTLDVNVAMFIVLDEPAGIKELGDAAMVNGVRGIVFPNPASETATLQFETTKVGAYKVELISANGQLLSTTDLGFRTIGSHQYQLEVNGFAAGNYFYSIVDEQGARYTKSFVVGK